MCCLTDINALLTVTAKIYVRIGTCALLKKVKNRSLWQCYNLREHVRVPNRTLKIFAAFVDGTFIFYLNKPHIYVQKR